MDVTLTSNLVIAALGVVAAWVQTRRSQRGSRAQLRQDVELLNLLPQESTSRSALLAHIDQQVAQVLRSESELTRDLSGALLAVFMLLAALALAIAAFRERGVWWLLLIPVILFGGAACYGIGDSLPKRKRDEKGNVISGPRKSFEDGDGQD